MTTTIDPGLAAYLMNSNENRVLAAWRRRLSDGGRDDNLLIRMLTRIRIGLITGNLEEVDAEKSMYGIEFTDRSGDEQRHALKVMTKYLAVFFPSDN